MNVICLIHKGLLLGPITSEMNPVQNLFVSDSLLISLPAVLYGCQTWSLILREENILRVFENRVVRRIFGPKSDEVTGDWRKLHSEELMICKLTHPQVVLCRASQEEWGGQCMWHTWVRTKNYTIFRWESPKERDHSEDRGVDWRMGSEWMLGGLVGGCGVDSVGSG
jgi:hypothetical protein